MLAPGLHEPDGRSLACIEMAEPEASVLDGVPLSPAEVLRQCSIFSAERDQPDPEYPVGMCEVSLSSGEKKKVALICIGETAGSFLVAAPFQAWHRTVARRVLPSTFLSKALACEVVSAPARDPGAETMSSKVWLGWLSPDYWEAVSFEAGEDSTDALHFDEDDLILPLASSLVEAGERSFGLQAVPSSFESVPPEDGQALGHRVAALESHLAGIKDQIELLVNLQQQRPVPPAPAGAAKSVAAAGTRPKAASAAAPALPGLDPAVAQAALAAGIPVAQLEEMSRLAAAGKPRLADLPRTAPKRKDPLSESEDDAFAVVDDAQQLGEGKEVDPMVAALTKLTAITQHLAGQKQRESSLEALLDGSGSQGGSESSGMPSSRKNAAALRALKKTLHSDPGQISKVIERNMEEDFQLRRTGVPGAPLVQVSARAWLEARSRVQNYKTPVTLLWGIAGILDALREQRPEEARARAGLLLCQGDQLSIDAGSWIVAASMSLEDPPPFAVFATHMLPSESESQVTKLIDSRWVDLFLHHLNEIDQLAEKKKKLAFRKNHDTGSDMNSPAPKRDAKGKGGKKGFGSEKGAKEGQKEASQ